MIKLSELEEGSPITLFIHNDNNSMEMKGTIKQHIKENFALIGIDYDTEKVLNFDNVEIRMEYDGDVPIVWNNVRIIHHKTAYVLQTTTDGERNNRRDSFRVGVSKVATITKGNGPRQVMVKDVSLSGFALTDRRGEITLTLGESVSIKLDDLGYELRLTGKLVRIETNEDVTIYGFEITNLCNDLSSYVISKQQKVRERK